MGISRVRVPSGYGKSFVLFVFFFFYSSFFFCLSLGAPLAPGPLDIVHPCHPVAMPLGSSMVNNQCLLALPIIVGGYQGVRRTLTKKSNKIFGTEGQIVIPGCHPRSTELSFP